MMESELSGFGAVKPRPLTERLKDVGESVPICLEAKQEIERLQRINEHLLECLRGISRQTAEMVRANE